MFEKIKARIILWTLKGAWEGDGIRRKIVVREVVGKMLELMEAKKMTSSYKTTIFGIIGAIGAYLITVKDPAWMSTLGGILAAIGTFGVGSMARDNDKSSEDVGANKPK